MAVYRISGVWKDADGDITHFAIHTQTEKSHTRGVKTKKIDAIPLVEKAGNTVTTWLWNYQRSFWVIGQSVHDVNGQYGKFLRTNHDGTERDNLDHLISMDWFQ